MADKRGTLPDWASALFAGAVAIGSGSGVYATMAGDIVKNTTEIVEIKNELVVYSSLVNEFRDLTHRLSTDVAVTKSEVEALKKTQEAAIRAIERMSASAEKLTIAIARLEERLKKGDRNAEERRI